MPSMQPFRGLAALLVVTTLALAPTTTSAQPALGTVESEEGAVGGMQPFAVVALSGYDAILGDIGYLGDLGGFPEVGQMIEGSLAFFTQGKGLVGIDKSKPWGVVVSMDGAEPLPIICLPINDMDAILTLIQGFGVMAADAGGGVTELTVPNSPVPLFAKESGEWVYLSRTAESLDNAPADPSGLLEGLVEDYDIGLKLMAKNVPEMYRQMAITGLMQGIEEGLEQGPDESDEQFEAHKKLADIQGEQIRMFIEDTDEIKLGIAINESVGPGLLIDVDWKATTGSALAAQFTQYQAASTEMAGFAKESAAVRFLQSTQTPAEHIESVVAQTIPAIAVLKNQASDLIDEIGDMPNEAAREALESAIVDVLDSVMATIETGKQDTGGYLSLESGEIEAVLGLKATETEKIESALRKLAALTEDDPEAPEVEWNAASHQGVNFHTMLFPVTDLEAQELLGPTLEVAVGIGKEMVCIGLGANSIAALTEAIDQSAATKGKTVPALEISLSVKKIAAFTVDVADGPDAASALMLMSMLEEVEEDQTLVVVSLDAIDDGVRYRVQVTEGVLTAIAKTIAEQAGGMMGQGGGPGFGPGF